MLRKLGLLIVALALVLPGSAAEKPGSISGYVHNSSGIPQMGALVEVLGSAARTLKVFTDENGFYSAAGLLPGHWPLPVPPASRDRRSPIPRRSSSVIPPR
jgi:hypothetical protein